MSGIRDTRPTTAREMAQTRIGLKRGSGFPASPMPGHLRFHRLRCRLSLKLMTMSSLSLAMLLDDRRVGNGSESAGQLQSPPQIGYVGQCDGGQHGE